MRLTDEQMGIELRALREAPREEFAARLDGRVESGFPAAKRRRSRQLTWGRLGLVLAPLAATAVLVVVVASSNTGSGGIDAGGDFSSGPTTTSGAGAVAPGARSAAPETAIPPIGPVPPNGTRPRNGQPQVQELSASLGLTTEAAEVQDAADGVVQVTDRYDGFVDSSQVHVGGADSHAAFSLRIPAAHLRDALDDLSDLGRVTQRDEGSTNVTGAYVDAGKGYREARARVEQLLAKLRAASSPSERADIKAQLVTARQQLAASRAALRGVKQRVTYAPVRVDIRAGGDGSWSIGDAADDAVGVLEATGGALLITLAVLVPLAALSAAIWLGVDRGRKRQRESALDR